MENLEARQTSPKPMLWHRKVAEILAPVSPMTLRNDMETWLLARIAESLEVDPLSLDPLLPPSGYGFETGAAKALTRDPSALPRSRSAGNLFEAGRSVRAVAHFLCAGTPARIRPAATSCARCSHEQLASSAPVGAG